MTLALVCQNFTYCKELEFIHSPGAVDAPFEEVLLHLWAYRYTCGFSLNRRFKSKNLLMEHTLVTPKELEEYLEPYAYVFGCTEDGTEYVHVELDKSVGYIHKVNGFDLEIGKSGDYFYLDYAQPKEGYNVYPHFPDTTTWVSIRSMLGS